MLVGLSMRRQCRAICVKRAIYFSRSRRECPRRNFGREESDSVSLQRPRGRESSVSAPEPAAVLAARLRYLLPGGAGAACSARRHRHPLYHNATIRARGKFEMPLTHHLVHWNHHAARLAKYTLISLTLIILLPFCQTSFWRQICRCNLFFASYL